MIMILLIALICIEVRAGIKILDNGTVLLGSFTTIGGIVPDRLLYEERCNTIAELTLITHKIDFGWDGVTEHEFCEFNIDYLSILSNVEMHSVYKNMKNYSNHRWFCPSVYANEPWESPKCDGISFCLADECNCDDSNSSNVTSVFFCPDKSGCVSMENVCDGTNDCRDASDECICENSIKFNCSAFHYKPYCMSTMEYCTKLHSSTSSSSAWFRRVLHKCAIESGIKVRCKGNEREVNPIHNCLWKNWDLMNAGALDSRASVISVCENNCSELFHEENWSFFCQFLVPYGLDGTLGNSFFCGDAQIFPTSVICDRVFDCNNGLDEMNCPGRFYCSENSTEWVDRSKVCDNFKDCSSGLDECTNCDIGFFSSSNHLISSKVVLSLTSLSCILTVLLNFGQGYACYRSTPANRTGQINRLATLQVYFYDMFMGLYQCLVVLATLYMMVEGRDYCMVDQEWRSSDHCMFLGILYTFSTHGSLLSIVQLSVYRALSLLSNNTIHISKSTLVLVSAVLACLNFLNTLIPVIPIPVIQNIFRSDIFLTYARENPGAFTANLLNYSHLMSTYTKVFNKKESNVEVILNDFKKTTSNSKLWHTTEIGYYGSSPLCLHNVFKSQPSFILYKSTYLAVISTLLLVMSAAYLAIIMKNKQAKRKFNDGNRHMQRNEDSISLTAKAVWMIGTQLLCWCPFIGIVIYYTVVGVSDPPKVVFEVISFLIIPINSLLNPLYYSNMYKDVVKTVRVFFCLFRRRTGRVMDEKKGGEAASSGLELSVLAQHSQDKATDQSTPAQLTQYVTTAL